MSGSSRDASGDEDSATGQLPVGGPSQVIGHIQAVFGSGTLTRASGAVAQVKVGDPVCQGDVIETAADGQIGILFIDGTAFNLSNSTRMVLNDFVCDSNGTLHSALFDIARGSFGFKTGQVAKTGCLTIETPVASIRGRARSGGIGTLSLAALTFAILDEAQAQNSIGDTYLPSATSHGVTVLDDGILTYKDFHFGIVELIIPGVLEHQFLTDPEQTAFIRKGSSTVEYIANTPADMAKLATFAHDALGTFLTGLAGATFSNATSTGSGGSQRFRRSSNRFILLRLFSSRRRRRRRQRRKQGGPGGPGECFHPCSAHTKYPHAAGQ